MIGQHSITTQALLHGERDLLQLIFDDTPLPQALDRICSAVDCQVGGVVSMVLSPEDNEHTLRAIGEAAARYGLFVFSCAAILTPEGDLCATLETYCCVPRSPTPEEAALVERAAHLAALAFRERNREIDFENFALRPSSVRGGYTQ